MGTASGRCSISLIYRPTKERLTQTDNFVDRSYPLTSSFTLALSGVPTRTTDRVPVHLANSYRKYPSALHRIIDTQLGT